MGKQGPCCHCGVSSTPLWRNGPVEKPVLCNACGSRWRTKGSLTNYFPLHARLDPEDYGEHRIRGKKISLKRRDEKPNKRKLNYDHTVDVVHTPEYSQTFRKILDEDTSNRSSSGSAISNSESYAQFGSVEASDLTGLAQSVVWDTLVPSKKRSCVARPKQSSVEKLTQDLHTILHEQASHFSGASEEELLFESGTPMGSVEFEHGSVLIRHPNSRAREEESEASSLSVDNKFSRAEESYATPASLLLVNNSKTFGFAKVKKMNRQIVQLEQAKRHKPENEKLPILWDRNSPLHQIDLTDIINSDVFWDNLTTHEQKHLLDYLPSVDTSTLSDSLRCVFDNRHFTESLSSFQQLLAEGVFDSSYKGVKTEDCEVLKRYALSNLTKCKWVELYSTIKDKTAKESTGECVNLSGDKSSSSGNVVIAKKFQDQGNHIFPEEKTTLKMPKRVLIKAGKGSKETVQNKGVCFIPTPRNAFALHTNGRSFKLDSFQLEEASSDDQDVLLNIPSNGSFAQAELLYPNSIQSALIRP